MKTSLVLTIIAALAVTTNCFPVSNSVFATTATGTPIGTASGIRPTSANTRPASVFTASTKGAPSASQLRCLRQALKELLLPVPASVFTASTTGTPSATVTPKNTPTGTASGTRPASTKGGSVFTASTSRGSTPPVTASTAVGTDSEAKAAAGI
ncbi:hypothetical protein BDR26DRAFT_1012666 [Obelidium mucronatum]|nr:hypothetical protein BDR26DRAFT_1012666 [Obelidium mucronatum]